MTVYCIKILNAICLDQWISYQDLTFPKKRLEVFELIETKTTYECERERIKVI